VEFIRRQDIEPSIEQIAEIGNKIPRDDRRDGNDRNDDRSSCELLFGKAFSMMLGHDRCIDGTSYT
jgi:hypothetical protein